MASRIRYNNLNDKFIETFLFKTFKNKKNKKNISDYEQLVMIYEVKPYIIIDVFKNIEVLGYWKDIFYCLQAANNLINRNKDVKSFIYFAYEFINYTIEEDLKKFRNKKNISSLAKWMPRENRSFDRKLNFVDNFTAYRYKKYMNNVDSQNLVKRKKEYRLMISELNKYLGTGEINFSNKSIMHEADFNKMTYSCIIKNRSKILSNEILVDKYKSYLTSNANNYTFWEMNNYILNIIDNPDYDFERNVVRDVFRNKVDDYVSEAAVIIDLNYPINIIANMSKEIATNCTFFRYIIGVLALAKYKNSNNRIFSMGKARDIFLVQNASDIFDIVNVIKMNICPNKYIDKYNINSEYPTLIITSNNSPDYTADNIPECDKVWRIDYDLIRDDGCDNFKLGVPVININKSKDKINQILTRHYPNRRYEKINDCKDIILATNVEKYTIYAIMLYFLGLAILG